MWAVEETGIVAFRDQRAIMRLSQTYNLVEPKHSQRVKTYDSKVTGTLLTVNNFKCDFYSGFVKGNYAYYSL